MRGVAAGWGEKGGGGGGVLKTVTQGGAFGEIEYVASCLSELERSGGVGGGVGGGVSQDSRLRICDAFAKGQVKLLSLEVISFFRHPSVHECICVYICMRVCQQLLRPQYVNIYYLFTYLFL